MLLVFVSSVWQRSTYQGRRCVFRCSRRYSRPVQALRRSSPFSLPARLSSAIQGAPNTPAQWRPRVLLVESRSQRCHCFHDAPQPRGPAPRRVHQCCEAARKEESLLYTYRVLSLKDFFGLIFCTLEESFETDRMLDFRGFDQRGSSVTVWAPPVMACCATLEEDAPRREPRPRRGIARSRTLQRLAHR